MKKDMVLLIFVTFYLVIYSIFAFLGFNMTIVFLMFLFSPILLIWLVLSILKAKVTNIKKLETNEEWGYQDSNKK